MKIFNTTTKKIEELWHPCHETDVMQDLTADDSEIRLNKEKERYEADADALEWWNAWIAGDSEVERKTAHMPSDWQEGLTIEVGGLDMEDTPGQQLAAIDEWCEKNGKKFEQDTHGLWYLVEKGE